MKLTIITSIILAALRITGLFVEFDHGAALLYKGAARAFVAWLAGVGWYESRYEWSLNHDPCVWLRGGMDREYKWIF